MSEPSKELSRLSIPTTQKSRPKTGPRFLILIIIVLAAVAVWLFLTGRLNLKLGFLQRENKQTAPVLKHVEPPSPPKSGDVILTVGGYVIPRERIEISPKFIGTVKWINVKKGDFIQKGEVLVQLEDDEYRARLLVADGNVAAAEANLRNADANLKRLQSLTSKNIESERALEEAQRAYDSAVAALTIARGQQDLAKLYLDWCTIRAPISGTILEKLVDPYELVVPQSFGGAGGPSTAFVSMADLTDLQVEIDLNEADTPKVRLGQRCRVSPEAYPDKKYGGVVVEIAPQANRAKGTLQVKVQIEKPDKFLTPELTAKVEFLAD